MSNEFIFNFEEALPGKEKPLVFCKDFLSIKIQKYLDNEITFHEALLDLTKAFERNLKELNKEN
jgi:hypothetical protein